MASALTMSYALIMQDMKDVRHKHLSRVRCLGDVHRLLLATFMIAGCPAAGETGETGEPLESDSPPITNGTWYRPGVAERWQWQLLPNAVEQINTSYEVAMVDLDLFNTPDNVIAALHTRGRRIIANLSVGTYEPHRSDSGKFKPADLGAALPNWPGERWLDIRSANVRQIMLDRLDLAVKRGFDGVELDNVDAYMNTSGFPLTADHQLSFNRFVANEAHKRKLSAGLKNDLEQIPQLLSYFDFELNEECHETEECDALRPFVAAGKAVFNAEYAEPFVTDDAIRTQMCTEARSLGLRTLVLPVTLDDSFRLSCDP